MENFSARLPRSGLEKPRSRQSSHPTFSYEHSGFSGVPRSRKPGQPSQPGSYEDALILASENRETKTKTKYAIGMVAEGKLSASISSSLKKKKAFTYNTQTNVEKESKTQKTRLFCFYTIAISDLQALINKISPSRHF